MRIDRAPGARRLLRNRPGQGMVEFVLLAPMLLLLILGLVEFARAWNVRHVVTDAAREAARYMVVSAPNATQDSAQKLISAALSASRVNPSVAQVTVDDGGGERGSSATVTINYPYNLSLVRPFLGWAVADAQITIRSSFVMRNE